MINGCSRVGKFFEFDMEEKTLYHLELHRQYFSEKIEQDPGEEGTIRNFSETYSRAIFLYEKLCDCVNHCPEEQSNNCKTFEKLYSFLLPCFVKGDEDKTIQNIKDKLEDIDSLAKQIDRIDTSEYALMDAG